MTHNQRFATKAYANIGFQTRGAEQDQYQLALMMFEAVLDNTVAARGAIETGDVNLKVQHIHKAVRILQDGLRTSLDLENGGELASNLANLYDYCILRLTQANAQNNSAAAAEVLALLAPVVDAWRQMRIQPPSTALDSKPTAAPDAAPSVLPNTPGKSTFSAVGLYARSMGGAFLAGA